MPSLTCLSALCVTENLDNIVEGEE